MRGDDQDVGQRLDRLEAAQQETRRTYAELQRTVTRIVSLMDGDAAYHIVGIPDQLAAYIKANEDWKKASETRIENGEERLSALENNNQIVIAPTTAALLIVIGALSLIVAYFVLTWLQNA